VAYLQISSNFVRKNTNTPAARYLTLSIQSSFVIPNISCIPLHCWPARNNATGSRC